MEGIFTETNSSTVEGGFAADTAASTDNDVVVDCEQQLSTPALIGLVCGGVVVTGAIIVLIVSLFWYHPNRSSRRRKHLQDIYDGDDENNNEYNGVASRSKIIINASMDKNGDSSSDQDTEIEK